jgi:hypothetical protein
MVRTPALTLEAGKAEPCKASGRDGAVDRVGGARLFFLDRPRALPLASELSPSLQGELAVKSQWVTHVSRALRPQSGTAPISGRASDKPCFGVAHELSRRVVSSGSAP